MSTVCSEDTGTIYDETNDEETEYDSEDNPDIRVIPGQYKAYIATKRFLMTSLKREKGNQRIYI